MTRFLALLTAFLLPISSFGATLAANETLDVSVSPFDNAYLAGAEVRVKAPLPADLAAAAGTLLITAPIEGDALLAGGTIDLTSSIKGDVRAAGGRVVIEGDVDGDIAVFSGALSITGRAHEVRAAGGSIEIKNGALGPVALYGGSVVLGGVFEGDVHVSASDSVTLLEGTLIKGALRYNAPQEAGIPDSVVVENGVAYTGSLSFLPTEEEAKTFALAGIGIFFVVKLIAGALASGILAGLFPVFSRRLVDETLFRSSKRFFLLALLGFAVFVATPVLVLLLLATFVGVGISILLGATYLFFMVLASLWSGLFAGAIIVRLSLQRVSVSWKTAMLGSVFLSLLAMVPFLGALVSLVLFAAALGASLFLFYRFTFSREKE